jgi:hypothetical protein
VTIEKGLVSDEGQQALVALMESSWPSRPGWQSDPPGC